MYKRLFFIALLLTLFTFNALSTHARNNKADKINDHEYVDMGLSVKWATCNVGASKPGAYGQYFAWGETKRKQKYFFDTYKYCIFRLLLDRPSEISKIFTKYVPYELRSEFGYGLFSDNLTRLVPEDDAATVNWGSPWRMPTQSEINELINNCSCEVVRENGHYGQRLTSKINGNSIFLPFGGVIEINENKDHGNTGSYWTSDLLPNCASAAFILLVHNGGIQEFVSPRIGGLMVRPVCE